jgi:hypothetical protein
MNPSQNLKRLWDEIDELCQENIKELEIRNKVKDAIM